MRRRALLASLGVGCTALSGCSALESSPSFAVDPDPRPEGMPILLDATLESEGSPGRPPTVDVSLTNDSGHEQEVSIASPSTGLPFFGTHADGPDGNALGLFDRPSSLRYDGCWKGTNRIGGNDAAARRTFSPGETMEASRFLFNEDGNSGCWPAGEYYFSEGYTVAKASSDLDYSEKPSYGWGFTVTIS